ncbi:cupin domain-containing protein [candidate division KSB1 bacterium]|nr:cupin domain-containing protein [candidate division KSB1 bacterium]RQW03120.1 MAG: cupin domain-containing protein [candidate division KSB1 bacterium]
MARYQIAQLDRIDAVACPCGQTRRAFIDDPDHIASVHLVDISDDARPHYHKKMTEIYTVLQGQGYIELDGESFAVQPMTVIKINPGCRHRAVGKLRILNTVIPVFDADDEWFD